MAAIWGIIKKNPNSNTEKIFQEMTNSMNIFPFDRIDSVNCNSSWFACGHQYYTDEDVHDTSPIYDQKSHIVFCSNCFLYNRQVLIDALNDDTLKAAGDSQIAYRAFQKWGFSFVNRLRGLFSFAVYEEEKAQLHLFSDHFNTSFTIYSTTKDYICFSTTYKPVLACLGNNLKINHEYIITAYKDDSPVNCSKDSITPFQNVYHLDYAIHLTINTISNQNSLTRYWTPLKNRRKIKYKTDEEYRSAFKSIFYDITNSILRSKDETGIMLSGGLDSSAVASFAAPILKKKGKYLYSYTSVPSDNYTDDRNIKHTIIDETPLIEIQKEYHSNIMPRYINGNNDSCISDIDYYQNFYDIPVKASINNINIINMSAAAKKDNCSILLSGSNGNATISYGYIFQYVSLNLLRFHFLKAIKEATMYCKRHGVSRIKLFKYWITNFFEYLFKKPKEDHDYLKPEDEKRYKLKHPLLDSRRKYGNDGFLTMRQRNNFVIYPVLYNQKGFYYTYHGLKNHYLQIDPTLTVEIVEFCLNIPLDCFVHNGIERSLVSDYLKDQLPEAITSWKKGHGVQCPDYHFRANRDIDKYREEIFRNLDEPLLREYLDANKIDPLINRLKEAAKNHSLDREQCRKLTLLASLGGFLRDHTKK